ncbi:MAG: bifunctional nuclease family protein [Chthonomonadaceae bacterium]|jgi:bifunctional DNase/RNase|nr:bifunctional nuclease family protein [Chthonomonadaceae bacterium]
MEDQPEEWSEFSKPPDFFPYKEPVPMEDHPGDYGDPVEVQVEAVFMTDSTENIQRFVLLSDGERKLPIVIGPFEASSIMLALDGQKPDRPLTHDLMKVMLDRFEADIDRVVIDDLWGHTYYAKIYIDIDGEEVEIDSRPSDAIALAIRCNATIYVAEGILDHAAD